MQVPDSTVLTVRNSARATSRCRIILISATTHDAIHDKTDLEANVDISPFYRHSSQVPCASRLSWLARKAIYRRFVEVICPTLDDTVLDVIGVTSDTNHAESNFFERLYPHTQSVGRGD